MSGILVSTLGSGMFVSTLVSRSGAVVVGTVLGAVVGVVVGVVLSCAWHPQAARQHVRVKARAIVKSFFIK